MNVEEHDPALERRFDLDDRPGPALRLSEEESRAIIARAFEAYEAPASTPRIARRTLRVLAIAATMILGVGLATAATRYVLKLRAPTHAIAQAPQNEPEPKPEQEPEPEPELDSDLDQTPPPASHVAPADLLKRANDLRGAQKWRAAYTAYAHVAARFPRSESSYVAELAAAELALEHLGDPARAKKLYERALAEQAHGALDAEARFGLAAALEKLGDDRGEAHALEELVRRHPDSPQAARARTRLEVLRRP